MRTRRSHWILDPLGAYNPFSISDFSLLLPNLNFSVYASSFDVSPTPDKVVVAFPPYFRRLNSLLSNTSLEVLEAYFVTRIALTLANNLPRTSEVWIAVRTLEDALDGIESGTFDRADWCVQKGDNALG